MYSIKTVNIGTGCGYTFVAHTIPEFWRLAVIAGERVEGNQRIAVFFQEGKWENSCAHAIFLGDGGTALIPASQSAIQARNFSNCDVWITAIAVTGTHDQLAPGRSFI